MPPIRRAHSKEPSGPPSSPHSTNPSFIVQPDIVRRSAIPNPQASTSPASGAPQATEFFGLPQGTMVQVRRSEIPLLSSSALNALAGSAGLPLDTTATWPVRRSAIPSPGLFSVPASGAPPGSAGLIHTPPNPSHNPRAHKAERNKAKERLRAKDGGVEIRPAQQQSGTGGEEPTNLEDLGQSRLLRSHARKHPVPIQDASTAIQGGAFAKLVDAPTLPPKYPCTFSDCKLSYSSLAHYQNDVRNKHLAEKERLDTLEAERREKTRQEGIARRKDRAAKDRLLNLPSLQQYEETRDLELDLEFDHLQEQRLPSPVPPDHETQPAFVWRTSRGIDSLDYQSEDEEDTTDPIQYRDVPGTLPHLLDRLQIVNDYFSDSDPEPTVPRQQFPGNESNEGLHMQTQTPMQTQTNHEVERDSSVIEIAEDLHMIARVGRGAGMEEMDPMEVDVTMEGTEQEGWNGADVGTALAQREGEANAAEETEAEKSGTQTDSVEYFVVRRDVLLKPEEIRQVRKVPEHRLLFDISGKDKSRGPFSPFQSGFEFKQARLLIRHRSTNAFITEGYNDGVFSAQIPDFKCESCGHHNKPESSRAFRKAKELSFSSVHTLRKKVDALCPSLSEDDWRVGEATFVADKKNCKQTFYFRPLKKVLAHFFKQPAFKNYLIYSPEKHYNAKGQRIYSDMYTADFYNDEQEKLPRGAILIPTLLASDSTKLSNQVGDHNLWPIYASVGNLPAGLRSRPSTNSWVLVAALPIPPKKDDQQLETLYDVNGLEKEETKTSLDERYKAFKDDALHRVLNFLLKELRPLYAKGLRLECADGVIRDGRPILAGWIADYQEYNKLCQIKQFGCAVCEIRRDQLGDNILGKTRDHLADAKRFRDYKAELEKREAIDKVLPGLPKGEQRSELQETRRIIHANVKALEKEMDMRELHARDSVFWHLPRFSVRSLWKPDILHTIYEGMVVHVLDWVTEFLQHHGRYARFEAAWLRIPPFQDMPAMKKAIGQNTQKTGKLYRKAIRCLLPALVVALKDPLPEQSYEFQRCLTAVRYLVDFILIAQYKYFTETTIEYMDHYLEKFHEHKDIFAKYRNLASRKTLAEKRFQKEVYRLAKKYAHLNKMRITLPDPTKPTAVLPQLKEKGAAKSKKDKEGGKGKQGKGKGSQKKGRGKAGTEHVTAPEPEKERATVASLLATTNINDKNAIEGEDMTLPPLPANWLESFWEDAPENVMKWMREELAATSIPVEEYDDRLNTIGDFIREKAEDVRLRALDEGGHFKFIKLHLLSHFSETVRLFGSLEQFSTEVGETLHKLPKEAYRASNKFEHVPQILKYCTRKYAIRMRELNLIQLAKDGHWEDEIQDALSLYASTEDRRQASKLAREGKGSLRAYKLRMQRERAQESDGTENDLADDEEEVPSDSEEEERLEPREETDKSIRLPPIIPLFSEETCADEKIHPLFTKPLDLSKGTRYFSGKVTGKRLLLGGLQPYFSAPLLVETVKTFLVSLDERYKELTVHQVAGFRVQVRTAVNIRARTVQSLEPYETMKAVCSGKGSVGRSGIRNDFVLYRKDDEKGKMDKAPTGPRKGKQGKRTKGKEIPMVTSRPEGPPGEEEEPETSFPGLGVGQLLVLFRVEVPCAEEIRQFTAGAGALAEEHFRTFRLAYLRVLNGLLAGPHGEMIPGPEVARFSWATAGRNKEPVYELVDIKALVRPAHLIPEHSDGEEEEDMAWVFNNRIDHGTWDLIYGYDALSSGNEMPID